MSPELARAFTSLLYFVAAVVDRDPHELRLGDLVRHLQGREAPHPMRRRSDLQAIPLVHPMGCRCQRCWDRRVIGRVAQ